MPMLSAAARLIATFVLLLSSLAAPASADEFLPLAKNARETMGMLFACDPAPTTDEEIAGIYARSFR